jgi:hypothetical protein
MYTCDGPLRIVLVAKGPGSSLVRRAPPSERQEMKQSKFPPVAWGLASSVGLASLRSPPRRRQGRSGRTHHCAQREDR